MSDQSSNNPQSNLLRGNSSSNEVHPLDTRVAIVELLAQQLEKEIKEIQALQLKAMNNHHLISTTNEKLNEFIEESGVKLQKLQQLIDANSKAMIRFKSFIEEHHRITIGHSKEIEKVTNTIDTLVRTNDEIQSKIELIDSSLRFHDLKFDKFARHGMIVEKKVDTLDTIRNDMIRLGTFSMKVAGTIGALIGFYMILLESGLIDFIRNLLN